MKIVYGDCQRCFRYSETDKCLCCGKELCDECRLEHGRIATEIKRTKKLLEKKKTRDMGWL